MDNSQVNKTINDGELSARFRQPFACEGQSLLENLNVVQLVFNEYEYYVFTFEPLTFL